MTRAGRVLAGLLAAAGLALAWCAVISWQHHSPPYAALFAACSLLCLASISHAVRQADEIDALLTELGQATTTYTTAQDRVVADAMRAWCCDVWAYTAGTDHADTCPRKDHHT